MPLSSQRGSSCPSIGPGSQHLTGGSESPSSVLWRLERTGLGRDHWAPFWFAGLPGPSLAFNLTSEHPSPDPFPGPPPCTCEGKKEGGQHPHLPTLVNPPEPDSSCLSQLSYAPTTGRMPWLIASLSGEGVTPEVSTGLESRVTVARDRPVQGREAGRGSTSKIMAPGGCPGHRVLRIARVVLRKLDECGLCLDFLKDKTTELPSNGQGCLSR